MSTARIALVILVLVSAGVERSESAPRTRGLGSAIAPTFTLAHDSVRPGGDVTLLACVSNQNPSSSRDMAAGTEFRFVFRDGILGACGAITSFSTGGAPSDADFQCSSDGSNLTIMHIGAPVAWDTGSMVCVEVGYTAGDRSSTVETSLLADHSGGWIGASPAAIPLFVSDAIGSEGPPGPVGPAGPPGPPGPTGDSVVGASVMAVSTAPVWNIKCQAPELIPGLDVIVTIGESSRLLVTLDAVTDTFCDGAFWAFMGRVWIEIDGVLVSPRLLDGSFGGPPPPHAVGFPVTYLSDPLSAGDHRVRAMLESAHPCSMSGSGHTACIGGTGVPNDGSASRLVVVELLN